MNATTQKVIDVVLDADGSVTPDQRDAALAILSGRTPHQWPPLLRELLERNQATVKTSSRVPPAQKVYLRRHDAAKYLACSVRQIDALKHDGDLPFHRLGRRLIVFKVEDLDALMRIRRIDVSDLTEH